MSTKQTFANNLKYLRHRMNLTQADISVDLNIERFRYSAWERGISAPNYDILVQISKLFDVGIDNLLTIDLSKTI